MYAMLSIGLALVLFSIPLLKRDIKTAAQYDVELETSRQELNELNELKYQVIAEIENIINNNPVVAPFDDVVQLAERGYAAEEIARRLNKGIGEIQTILHLDELRRHKVDDKAGRSL